MKAFTSLALIVLFALPAMAQQKLDVQHALEADAVMFRFDSTQSQIEVYYGILQRALAFKESGNALQANVNARVEIWQNGKVTSKLDIDKPVRYELPASALDSIGANKLLGAAAFVVPTSALTTAAFIWLDHRSNGSIVADTIAIPLAPIDRNLTHFAVGGIELASNLQKATDEASPFLKAGYIVTPNPSAIFGENYTTLYYYSELYVPQPAVDPSQTVDVTTSVTDPRGKEILTNTVKQPLVGTRLPIMSGLDIDGLAGDAYKIHITVKQDDAIVAEEAKPFYYVSDMKLSEEPPTQTDVQSDDILFATSDISKLSDEEADERIAQSLYLGTEADRKTAKSLKSLPEKQHFLFSFWRKQDAKHPATQPLYSYTKFEDRVNEANKLYSYQKTPGWKSARGRVYIVYGPAPTVTTELFDPQYKPYIIWEYDNNVDIRLTSGTRPQFVFLDRQGGGNFVLVHSNVLGEQSNPDWKSRDAYQLNH